MRSSDMAQRTLNVTRTSALNLAPARLRAFTFVELLVVIVVISLLVAILAPFIDVAMEQARRSDCRKRLQNLHKAAAMYAGENRNLVPLVHEGATYGAVGQILASGGRFARKYMEQSCTLSGAYAIMNKADNVFQCPSALDDTRSDADKKGNTNYSLSGFGLYVVAGVALHPSTMVIGGTVQAENAAYPPGEVAMAIDWIWSRDNTSPSGASRYNHLKGANVLYGSGAAEWVSYESMTTVTGESGMLVPPGTYGFVKGGASDIYAPFSKDVSKVIRGGAAAGDRAPGRGIMW